MYSVANMLFGIATTVFTGYGLVYYFDSFMEKRKLLEWNGKYLIIISYIIMDYLLDYIFQSGIETKDTNGKQFLFLGIIYGFAKLFYHSERQMPVFLTITFVALKDLSAFISTTFIMCSTKLFDIWIVLLDKGYVSAELAEQLIDGTASILQLIMMAIYFLLFYKSLKMVVKNYKNKDYFVRREELLFLLTPGCVAFLLCILLRTILITMEDGMPIDLYEKYPGLLPVVPLILILTLISIVYSVKLFQDMITVNVERSEKLILEKQLKNMQEHIAEMEHIYDGVRSMKHDMKNTLSVIMQLAVSKEQMTQRDCHGEAKNHTLENQHDEELERYLKELNQTMDRLEFQYKTGNSVVDVLLNMKYHELIRTMPDIRLNADKLLFPHNLKIQSYDLGIIIGNALDNAVEACRKLKCKEPEAEIFIILSSFIKGNMFFMEVENSFDGKIVRDKHTEFPITDKSDKKVHGIGLSNIKKTAEKYRGGVDWSVENKKFILTIMLQNERK